MRDEEEWSRIFLEEVVKEAIMNSPIVLSGLKGVCFISQSKGKKKKKRKYSKRIMLIRYYNKWHSINEEKDASEKIHWDKIAMEIFGEKAADEFYMPGEYLKKEILAIFERVKKF